MFRTNFKKALYQLHLWLGLCSGLVVFILGITGAIYAFSDELKEILYQQRLYVEVPAGAKPKSFDELLKVGQAKLGSKKKISRVEIQTAPNRSYMFRSLKSGVYFEKVYVDPYTARVVFHEDANREFFNVVLSLHRTLLLGDKVGHFIIRWSVICFVFLLLSGIVLWWPTKWKANALKAKFKVKWNAKKKRLNYDLHQVFGFYAFIVLLIIALTGLMWSFDLVAEKKTKLTSDTTKTMIAASNNQILSKVVSFNKTAAYYLYNIPAAKSGTVNVSAYLHPGKIHQRIQYRFDRYSGKLLLQGKTFETLPLSDQIKSLNYDLHTGTVIGIWGKIIVFIAGLIAASLPVTGFLMWLWRRKNK
ncbi:PepSY-associated TM helix [compost metagenome]